MTNTKEPRYYTVPQAARELGVAQSTVWRWIGEHRLPAYRIGPKTIRIRREDLEALVRPARQDGEQRAQMPSFNEIPIQTGVTLEPLTEEDRRRGLQALEEARAFRERVAARRGGKPFPEAWRLIRRERDRRSREL